MMYADTFDGELKEIFILTDEEVKALYDFFLRDGYISYEKDPLVILLIRRLSNFLELQGKENE